MDLAKHQRCSNLKCQLMENLVSSCLLSLVDNIAVFIFLIVKK